MMIIEAKAEYLEQLIDGYENLNEVYQIILKMMQMSDYVDNVINSELIISKENMHYLKL